MIATVLLDILWVFLSAITAPFLLLADVVLPAQITDAIEASGSGLYVVNQIVPVATILTILGLFLTVEGFIFAYKIILWVIRKIPGLN